MTKISVSKILLKRAYIFICSLLFFQSSSFAANEFVTGFEMSSCAHNKCSKLTVEGSVEKGVLAPLFAFGNAKLTHKNQENNTEIVFHALDGYYDSVHSEIVLRGVKELGGGESLIDLKSGQVKVFRPQKTQ